jgi:hypothetical protein
LAHTDQRYQQKLGPHGFNVNDLAAPENDLGFMVDTGRSSIELIALEPVAVSGD